MLTKGHTYLNKTAGKKVIFLNLTSIFLKDFDHNYYNNYNNSLKYAANIILSSVTTILVNIKGEVLQP